MRQSKTMASLTKLTPATVRDLWKYFSGRDPIDIWEFEYQGIVGRVENSWRKGARLILNGETVTSNNQLIAVRGSKPLMSYELKQRDRESVSIKVFVKAFIFVKIKVTVNEMPLNDVFI